MTEVAAPAEASKVKVLRRLWTEYCKQEVGSISIGLGALAVNAYTNLSFPSIIGKCVDLVSAADGSAATVDGESFNNFMVSTFKTLLCGAAASLLRVYCLGTANSRIQARLKMSLFNSYIDKDIDFFENSSNTKGEILTIIDTDTVAASDAFTTHIANGLRSLNSSINGSIQLFRTSAELCGVSLSVVPLVGIGAMTISKYSRKLQNALRQRQGAVLDYSIERFMNISTVKLNNRESHEKQTYESHNAEVLGLSSRYFLSQGVFMSFINAATNVSIMSILYVGAALMRKGKMTSGTLTKFAMTSAFVGLGFSGLSTFYSDMSRSVEATRRLLRVIDDNSGGKGKRGTSPLATGSSSSSSTFRFEGVSFAYKSRPDELVLNNVSVSVARGGITGFVGKSGCGKTTVLSLICGLHEPSSGRIFFGDTDISTMGSEWIRQNVGVVEQKLSLFSGSIYDNIAYGKAGSSSEEVERAAKLAFASDFIDAFPDKYQTQVGTGGQLLSGGQSARIALARALIKQPAFLLLDEATGSLDEESERFIIDALLMLSKTTTIIVFTHSEKLAKSCACVHLVQGGVIDEGRKD